MMKSNQSGVITVFGNRGIDYHIVERIRGWALKDIPASAIASSGTI